MQMQMQMEDCGIRDPIHLGCVYSLAASAIHPPTSDQTAIN
jgi:hypothetical protein